MLARVTVEILGAVPITEVEVVDLGRAAGAVGRAARGRVAGGRAARCCGRGRGGCWPSPVGTPTTVRAVALPEAAIVPPPQLGETFGYAHAVEWRWARGGWEERGPGGGLDADEDRASSRARSRRRASG